MKNIYILSRQDNFFLKTYLASLKKLKIDFKFIIIDKQKYTYKQKKMILDRIHPEHFCKDSISKKRIIELDHSSSELLNFFKKNKADLILNLGTPKILKKKQISNLPPILNCHPGILPYYKGCNSPEWSLLNKDPLGATVHIMNEKIDNGKILSSTIFKKTKFKNYRDFRTYIYLSCIHFFCKVVKSIILAKKINLKLNKIFLTKKKSKYWEPMNKKEFNQFIKILQ